MKEFDVEKFHVEKIRKEFQQLSSADAIHAFQNKCLHCYPQHTQFIQDCAMNALYDCVVRMHKHKDYQDKFGCKHPTLWLLASMVFWMVVVGFIYTIY